MGERLTSAGLRHQLKITDLDKSIKDLGQLSVDLAERVKNRDIAKVGEGYPGEAMDKITAELAQVEDAIVETREMHQREMNEYEADIELMKKEKLGLVERFKDVKAQHKAKCAEQDAVLEALRKEFGIVGEQKEENKIQSKQTGRGRRIPKGKKKDKKKIKNKNKK